MNTVIKAGFLILVGIACMVSMVLIGMGVHEVRYDCRLAEISPDIPQQVKEQCRTRYLQHNEQN